ncbi:SMI1/KNR4 family protein [Bacillus sp. WMMC1349]|uniref:SMI1/KNR4 family protein n=1 Tax=Bacillus sp. WMMC1349 TaxID=2736254 RepID=UPI001552F12F|nr:SMI1/KNR4 family protein [Bacillus sp. WMMC1349]NPC91542.1 SMI1/KNR4 family protein [Bacillus sp. WMMC1349]
MNNYNFLLKYIVNEDNTKNMKHQFYPLKKEEIKNAEERMGLRFPNELRNFYITIGYGFMHRDLEYQFNRLIDPHSVVDIRLRDDFYEYDPDLELYEDDAKLVFFEIVEGFYLSIDFKEQSGKNAVYFVDTLICDSFAEFLMRYDQNAEFYHDLLES